MKEVFTFLEKELMRVFQHAFIGLTIGYWIVLRTYILDMKIVEEKAVIIFFATLLFVGAIAWFWDFFQNLLFQAMPTWSHFAWTVTFGVVGGYLCWMYKNMVFFNVLLAISALLVSIELVKYLIIKDRK